MTHALMPASALSWYPALLSDIREVGEMSRPQPPEQQLGRRSLSSVAALHRYACVRCRSRRVKCDKFLSGCANCASHGQSCVYSARRPRKSQTNGEVSAAPRPLLPVSTPPSGGLVSRAKSLDTNTTGYHVRSTSPQYDLEHEEEEEEEEAVIPHEYRDADYQIKTCSEGGHRILINSNGNARFVHSEKVKQFNRFETDLLAYSQKHKISAKQDMRMNRNLDANSLLNASYDNGDMSLYQPPPSIMHLLWDFFQPNVDMMAKVLYRPAVSALIERASTDKSCLTNEEPLLFAIWLAAVATMSPAQCLDIHHETQSVLIRRYRYALDQSLVKNKWMTTQNIPVLQSLALYLVFSLGSVRTKWILSGIALSAAQAMGMHTDSTSYDFDPIQTEVRRRLWWMLCQLDVRISEDSGLQCHVPLEFSTKLPLHINDVDLAAVSDGATPIPKNEFTDMTLSLIKMEFAKTSLQIKRAAATADEKREVINLQLQRYEDVWLKYLDKKSELHRLCTLGTRLIMSRLWKLQLDDTGPPTTTHKHAHSGTTDPNLLIYHNADILDMAHQLPCKYRRYGWFFRCKRSQWHAVVYLLVQMCTLTTGPAAARAWAAIDLAFANWERSGLATSTSTSTSTSEAGTPDRAAVRCIWGSLLRLRDRAHAARAEALSAHRSPETVGELGRPSASGTEHEQHGVVSERRMGEARGRPGQGAADELARNALISGDPFFGAGDDVSAGMDWGELDQWVEDFRGSLQQQQKDDQNGSSMGAFEWW